MAVARTATYSTIGYVTGSTTISLGSQSIGTAAADRIVLVGVVSVDTGGTGFSVTGVTINGSGATSVGSIGTTQQTAWWWALVPSGTTATIDVVYSGTANHALGVSVYSVTGAHTTTPIAGTGGNVATSFPVSVTVPVDGAALAIGTKPFSAASGATAAWTGLTEDVDTFANINGVYDINLTSASNLTPGANSVSVTWTGTGGAVLDGQLAMLAVAPPAGPWTLVGLGTNTTVTATGITLVEPAGVAPGDLLVACIAFRAASATSVTLPAGWTRVGEQKTGNTTAAASTSIANGVMAYIVRGGSAPSYAFTLPAANVGMGRVIAYRGQHASSPFDLSSAATTATATTAVSVTGLTTSAADELLVAMVGAGRGGTWTNFRATTPATGSGTTDTTTAPVVAWTERTDNTTTSGADVGLAMFDALKSAAGATGNFLTTGSLSAGHAVIVGAFKLAVAAGAGRMKVWSGSAWVIKPVKYWTGSAWVEKPIKAWTGSAWV